MVLERVKIHSVQIIRREGCVFHWEKRRREKMMTGQMPIPEGEAAALAEKTSCFFLVWAWFMLEWAKPGSIVNGMMTTVERWLDWVRT